MSLRLNLLRLSGATALALTPALAGCDTGPSDPFAAAQEAFASGQPRTALDLVGKAIDAQPNNPAVRMLAGDAAMALDNPDRAIAEYQSVSEDAQEYSIARAKLAEAQVMGNYLEAARESVESLQMDNAHAYTAKIAFHLARGETDAAYNTLDEGLTQFIDDPRLVTVDAERLWAQGKAVETFDRLTPVLKLEPAVSHAHLFAGKLRLGMRDAKEAQSHFQKVLSVRPMHQTAMLAMAAIARDAGETQEAGNWINKANDAGPAHPIGLLFAAQMAFDAGDLNRAFELIEKAPSAVVNEPEFARLRGMIDAGRGQNAMAALALGDYVEATGGDPFSRQVLANSLAEQGKFDEAWAAISPVIDHPQSDQKTLTIALALAEKTGEGDPASIRAKIERKKSAPSIEAEMREAATAIRASDWAKADRIYAPLIEGAGKEDPGLLNNAAAVKTKLGDHDQAVALARRALGHAPTSAEIMDTLGWALWQGGGDKTEARKLLQKAREGSPANREIAEHWAIANAL
ncbi:MAG: tetratricopeptide repeat protein [Erythrobacter sp.]|uniref:tetratricopeptide repeat protein n=1 Tax=Erythrobacter sp. TaxID=1042 RepID=UPI00329A1CFE